MFLVFELIMRYCDYQTFKTCSILNKECNRICRKLVSELKRVKKFRCYYHIHQIYWRNKKQGLSYYVLQNTIQIFDYDDDELIARYYNNRTLEYIEFDFRQYHAKIENNLTSENQLIKFPKIPGYSRNFISLKPIENSIFFKNC